MLKNCENCNRVFSHPSRSMCHECYKEAQRAFGAVKEFLQGNPGATVAEVSQETDVDVEVIYEYIRQGRLTVVPKDAQLSCEVCGTSIKVGRLCARCRSGLKGKEIPETRKVSDGSRVHFLNELKGRR